MISEYEYPSTTSPYPEIHTAPLQSVDPFNIPYFNIAVNPTAIISSSLAVLLAVFPSFRDDDIKISTQGGGLTNQLVKVKVKNESTFGMGSGELIDRTAELGNFCSLAASGFGPPVYASFTNGLVYGYVEGSVFQIEDLRAKWNLVAKRVAEWHEIESLGTPSLFRTISSWISKLDDDETLCGLSKNELREEAGLLQSKLMALGAPVVFCHNDLTVGNLISCPDSSIEFIDFEYGSLNYAAFDLGNHFCEFGGVAGDWTKYPDHAFRKEWFKVYLHTLNGRPASSSELDILDKQVLAFSLASHFQWSIWALIQSGQSEIDFDYKVYGERRMKEYFEKKAEWLA